MPDLTDTDNNAEVLAWIQEKHFAAHLSIDKLKQAKRQRSSDYDERIRKLANFQKQLGVIFEGEDQMEMFKPEQVLTPEIKRFLLNPTDGID